MELLERKEIEERLVTEEEEEKRWEDDEIENIRRMKLKKAAGIDV